jgi:hypothetical protein
MDIAGYHRAIACSFGTKHVSIVHPEIGKFGRDQGVGENLTAGIWLIFRGLNFSRNADIGQIGHLWMGTI